MADIHYKRRFGDRNDGRLLRSLTPYFRFIPFVMKDRNDASNYFSDQIEVSDTVAASTMPNRTNRASQI